MDESNEVRTKLIEKAKQLEECVTQGSHDKAVALKVEVKMLIFGLRVFSAGGGEFSANDDKTSAIQEWEVARNALETILMADILLEDDEDFPVTFPQLCAAYFETSQSSRISERQALCIGLGLMNHIVNDEFEAFHVLWTKIEGFSTGSRRNSATETMMHDEDDGTAAEKAAPMFFGVKLSELNSANQRCVTFPLEIEQHLLNGNMSRVMMLLTGELPHPVFGWFTRVLVPALRLRLAQCIELSFESLGVGRAVSMLKLNSRAELLDFARERNRGETSSIESLNEQQPVDRANLHEVVQTLGDELGSAGKADSARVSFLFAPPPGSALADSSEALNVQDSRNAAIATNSNRFSQWVKWSVNENENRIYFTKQQLHRKSKPDVPHARLIMQFLGYAQELEAIV